MKKVSLRLFDGRRNQNFWFHFCYLPDELWEHYTSTFKVGNLDSQVKAWLKLDFGLDVACMEDIHVAKEHIKKLYAEVYPEVYLDTTGDRQGWSRVWLSEKIKRMMEAG